MTGVLLQLEDVAVDLQSRPVLRAVSGSVAAGTLLAILGPSGAGKTTLLRGIAGLEPLAGGRLLLEGRAPPPPGERRLGFLFQDLALWPHLTIAEQLRFVLRSRAVPRERWSSAIERALQRSRALSLSARLPGELSAGEAQRAALARAWVDEPRLLLLDEPFSHLDPLLRDEIFAELASYAAQSGAAVLSVSHLADEALARAQRVWVLDAGRLVADGSPEELWRACAHPRAARLLGPCSFIAGEHRDGRFHSCLGDFPLPEGAPVGRLLVRPDSLIAQDDGPIEAEVLGQVLRGGSLLERVRVGAEEVSLRLGRPRGAVRLAWRSPPLLCREEA